MNINPNPESSASQCARIKAWLEDGNKLTQLDALKLFGCFRLASRIHDLRDRGLSITWNWKVTESGKRVKEYMLAQV